MSFTKDKEIECFKKEKYSEHCQKLQTGQGDCISHCVWQQDGDFKELF